LSPLGTFNDMGDDDPEMTFGHVAEKLNEDALAYLHIVNPAVAAIEKGIEPDPGALRMLELMRERYRGTFIIAGGFDHDTAESWLQQGKADLIATPIRCPRLLELSQGLRRVRISKCRAAPSPCNPSGPVR
jgi:N-ethylmaleimide reductase